MVVEGEVEVRGTAREANAEAGPSKARRAPSVKAESEELQIPEEPVKEVELDR